MNDYDIIISDIDAWNAYPKFHWMYSTTALLDAQNIKWAPFETADLDQGIPAFTVGLAKVYIESCSELDPSECSIFIANMSDRYIRTEALIRKGQLKWFAHFDQVTHKFDESVIGEVDLRINAFVTLYFKKFNGIVSFETYGSNIVGVKLRPTVKLIPEYPANVFNNLKRLFPKQ